MTTVLFVHGTGARGEGVTSFQGVDGQEHVTTFGQITAALGQRQPDLVVQSCAWGEKAGYTLHAHGISIPTYHDTGGVLGLDDEAAPAEPNTDALIWGVLYRDPTAELRLLAAQASEQPEAAGQGTAAGSLLDGRVQHLSLATASPELRTNLATAGLTDSFDGAVQTVRADRSYRGALPTLADADLETYRTAVARAIVAEAAMQSEAQGHAPLMLRDATARDATVRALAAELALSGMGTLGLFTPLENKGIQLMAQVLTGQMRGRRGGIMDKVLGFIGDILVYQGEGKAIRDQIRASIDQATAPVVIIGHSLGGIACVDLLIEQDLHDRVPLLITCGSQAPVFYEMGALESMPYDAAAQLPAHFPPWLNIYDLQDMLSFLGGGLFAGRVKDVAVDNRQPFPYAHSAYWSNGQVWDAIMQAISNPAAVLAPA